MVSTLEMPCWSSSMKQHTFETNRIVEGEERWIAIGMAGNLPLLAVTHTSKEERGEEVIRIISARKATKHEAKTYYAQFGPEDY